MFIFLIGALLASGDQAAPATTAAATSARPSAQVLFNAATEAFEAGRYDEAVKGFEALEALPAVKRNRGVQATVLMRKGVSLVRLGRNEEAAPILRAAEKLVPLDQPELRADRANMARSLGTIELDQFNYPAAADQYSRSAELTDDPTLKALALLGLSRATMFEPGEQALHAADRALEIFQGSAGQSKAAKKSVADIQTIRARAMLNLGRHAEAFDILKKAVADQGGLDFRVNYAEIVTRSDLALAALLAGKEEEARRYLAFTGAGRMKDAPFQSAVSMQPPPCGGPTDLKPEDVAVIEFDIQVDGTVRSPTLIYSSAKGAAAIEFARAAADWSWRPESVAKIPALFRYATRVELRCSTSTRRPPIDLLLKSDLAQWLQATGVPPAPPATTPAADIAPLRAELARREAAGGVALIPILLSLASNPITPPDEQQAATLRARDLAAGAGAPLPAVMAIEIQLAAVSHPETPSGTNAYRADLRSLLARPGTADIAKLADTLKLLIAEPGVRAPAPSDAATLLQQVADDTRLNETNPLRVGALVRMAALQAAAGDVVKAATTFRRSGLDAQQCALLDAKPKLQRDNVGVGDFPDAAMAWGFEGWVKTEFDIMPDGKTAAQRAIVAYPPFVFRNAALEIIKDASYTKSYRPGGGPACGGEQQSVNFIAR